MESTAAPLPSETRPYPAIRTTLYDLIAAINVKADPEDEHLVVATVVYLLDTGQVTFLGKVESNN